MKQRILPYFRTLALLLFVFFVNAQTIESSNIITDGEALMFNGTSLTAYASNNLNDFKASTLDDLDGVSKTWFVDTATKTLYLYNFEYAITSDAMALNVTNDAKINIKGTCSLSTYCSIAPLVCGIYLSSSSLTLWGDGTLNLTSMSDVVDRECYGVYGYGELIVESGILNARGGNSETGVSSGIYLSSCIINGGTINAVGGDGGTSYGFYTETFNMTGGTIIAQSGVAGGISAAFKSNNTVSDVIAKGGMDASEEYDLTWDSEYYKNGSTIAKYAQIEFPVVDNTTPQINIDGADPVDVSTMAAGSLVTATTIEFSGEWNSDNIKTLAEALHLEGIFSNENSALQSVTYADGAEFVGTSLSLASLFSQCKSLTSVNLPAYTTGPVAFTQTFNNCTSLKRVNSETDGLFDLGAFSGGLTINLSKTFENCQYAESIELPDTNTSNAFHMYYAFSGCASLKRINSDTDGEFDITFLKGDITTGLSYGLGFAFTGCKQAIRIILPDYTAGANGTNGINFSSTFSGCTSLQIIENLDTYKSINKINNTFKDCHSLLYAKIDAPIGTAITTAGRASGAFEGTNPNCLKYLPAEAELHTDWEAYSNFIIGNESYDDIVLADRVGDAAPGESDFNPFYCPRQFTIKAGNSITYTRPAANLKYATRYNGWNTLALPFDATLQIDGLDQVPVATTVSGDYWLRSCTNAAAGGELTFADTEDGTIAANTPYIFALPAGMQDKDAVFAATSTTDAPVTVKAGNDVDYSNDENFSFRAAFTPQIAQPMYLLTAGEGDTADSFALYDKGNIASFRAYFEAVDVGSLGIRRLSFGADSGETTSLSPITVADSEIGKARKVVTRDGIRIIDGNNVYSVDGVLIEVLSAE